jgi:GT2 family glycosyltransferase
MTSAIAAMGIGSWAHVDDHGINGGFAAGNNRAMACADELGWAAHWYLFLNPDAQLEAGALRALAHFSNQLAGPAAIGMQQLDEQGQPRPSAFWFPSLISELQRGASLGLVDRWFPKSRVAMPMSSTPHECDWVTGAAFALPRCVVDKVGPMDEGYFLYYEEVEYMHRIRRAGFPVWTLPAARVTHRAGAATGVKGGSTGRKPMPAYWYQSWRRFFITTHGQAGMWACGCAWLVGRSVNQLLSLMMPRRRHPSGHRVGSFIRLSLLGKKDSA